VALAGLVLDDALRRRSAGRSGQPPAPPALESPALGLLAAGAAFGALDHAAAGPARAAAAALLAAGGLLSLLPAGWGARWAAQLPAVPPRSAAAAAFALAWALGGLTAVPAGHVGVVERLGAPLPELLSPGLSWRLPPPLERVRPIDRDGVRSEPLLDGAAPLLCGDQSLAALRASLRWSVADPVAFAYGAADTPAALQAIGRAALSEEVGRRGLDDVLTSGRGALETAARDRAAAAADRLGLGVQIHAIHLAEARVPAPVQAAFSDVISADEERHTTIDEAEAYAARVLPEAGGEALHRSARAAADAAHALARARALAAWHAALAPAPASTLRRLEVEATEARLAPLQLRVLPRDLALWPSPGPADVR
jgi:membrane protease subunit HflK